MALTDAHTPAPGLTLWRDGQQRLWTLDQTRLPFETRVLALDSLDDCIHAIRSMQVRGAPLIGAVAGFGMALGLRAAGSAVTAAQRADIRARLLASRPTAVNLRWALARIDQACQGLAASGWAEAAWAQACAISALDEQVNRAIGRCGADLLAGIRPRGPVLQVLTHCNAGRLATVAHGTALAPIYEWHRRGGAVHVWVDETRPRNQGASLTAWELADAGIDFTIIADNAGGLLMMQSRVDVVIVGCDRVAANGDVANKVGTYLKALAARDHGVPFHVACPLSTVDLQAAAGADIPIEYRDGSELHRVSGRDGQGREAALDLFPPHYATLNPAFDVTPAAVVTAYLTEAGVCDAAGLARHAAQAARPGATADDR